MTALMPRHSSRTRAWRTGGLLLGFALLASCAPPEPDPAALRGGNGALYTDGEYITAFAVTAPDGWQPWLAMRVRAGLITELRFDALDAGGNLLSGDERYREQIRLETGVVLPSLISDLERGLLERQQLPMTVPAGGREWVARFAVLAGEALGQARAGAPGVSRVAVPGPYVAEDLSDELGWRVRLVMMFGADGPEAAYVEELRTGPEGSVTRKADDAEYTERYQALMGVTPAGVAEELAARLVPAAGEERRVAPDAVSGATATSLRVASLAAEISDNRVNVALPPRPFSR
jgi:major membrane immunogen (membrane-anchored lipoprotein)